MDRNRPLGNLYFSFTVDEKWGITFAIFTLICTLSTSIGILIYHQVWINALRVIINTAIIIYLFRRNFF